MEASLGFKVGASGSQEVAVSASKPISLSGRSTGFDSTYVTPHSKQGVMSSTPPLAGSPASFHTADQLDDYQHDVNSEVLESPSSTPPADGLVQTRFYSDGRPRPVTHDGDDESRDSFEDGGYTTATQIPVSRFADPDQPKLLLAEEPIQPLAEKKPLQDASVQPRHRPTSANEEFETANGHRRGHNEPDGTSENTPLLPTQHRDTYSEEKNGCCCIL